MSKKAFHWNPHFEGEHSRPRDDKLPVPNNWGARGDSGRLRVWLGGKALCTVCSLFSAYVTTHDNIQTGFLNPQKLTDLHNHSK